MNRHWWLAPLYWIIAAAPLAAAFWVFQNLPAVIYLTPTMPVPTGRAGVWGLPIVNVLFAVALPPLTGKMARMAEAKGMEADLTADLHRVLPGIRIWLMAFLSGVCLAAVYGHYVLETSGITLRLVGRVSAFVPGVGVAVFALGLPHRKQKHILALRWTYTERSPQVWLKTHKLGALILYATGAIMVGTAFLADGLWATVTAGFALFSALFGLYLYAKHLYEDEFR